MTSCYRSVCCIVRYIHTGTVQACRWPLHGTVEMPRGSATTSRSFQASQREVGPANGKPAGSCTWRARSSTASCPRSATVVRRPPSRRCRNDWPISSNPTCHLEGIRAISESRQSPVAGGSQQSSSAAGRRSKGSHDGKPVVTGSAVRQSLFPPGRGGRPSQILSRLGHWRGGNIGGRV